MTTKIPVRRVRRTEDEIRTRVAAYRETESVDPTDHADAQYRIWVLNDAVTWPDRVRDATRSTVRNALYFTEPDVAFTVARLEEFAWLQARDDVLTDMSHVAEHRGKGWPELWSFAVHFDRYTEVLWAEAVARTPEIAKWAAGLPVPTEPEPF